MLMLGCLINWVIGYEVSNFEQLAKVYGVFGQINKPLLIRPG